MTGGIAARPVPRGDCDSITSDVDVIRAVRNRHVVASGISVAL